MSRRNNQPATTFGGNGQLPPDFVPTRKDEEEGDSCRATLDSLFNREFGNPDTPDAKILTAETYKRLAAGVKPEAVPESQIDAASAVFENATKVDRDFVKAAKDRFFAAAADYYSITASPLSGLKMRQKELRYALQRAKSERRSMRSFAWNSKGKLSDKRGLKKQLAIALVIGCATFVCLVLAGEISVAVQMLSVFAPDLAGESTWQQIAMSLFAVLLPTLGLKYISSTVGAAGGRWFQIILYLLVAGGIASIFLVFPQAILGSAGDPFGGS